MHILTFSLQEEYDEITCHPNFLIRGRNAMMLPFKWTSSAKRLRSTTCISFLGFHQKNLNFLLELLTTHKSERVNVIPSYKPRLQASTIWPWMVWISGQILSTYFFTSWTEHVHTTQKIHKIKAQLQTQFCLAILKLNIDLSTMDVHSGVYHFAKNYPSGVGWVGFGDFPDIPTNTEGAAVPRLSSSFLLILQIVLSSVATEFNVNE